MATLDEKRRQRLQFMEAVYDATQGDRFMFTQLGVIAPVVGLSEQEADQIAQYLVDEGLLGWAAFGGVIEITHQGIREVEQARAEPNKPTKHFPPFNFIHVEHMIQSQIQQGTVGSVQNLTQPVAPAESSDLARFIEEVKRLSADLGLVAEAEMDLDAQVATIEAQMKSPRPQRAVVKAAGGVLVEILKSASGSAARELIKQLPNVLR